jgi:hypothetical protein
MDGARGAREKLTISEAFGCGHVFGQRFYNRDVVGHHRAQILNFEDILNRLAWDQKHNASPIFDIKDIVAAENRFAIRFEYTAQEGEAEQGFHAEVIYFYHLRENKISEFWLLSDHDFDYKAPP